MSKIKDFINSQRDSMLFGIVLLIIAIILVIVFCGIFGNNEDNFWRECDNTELVSEDSNGKPRPPFYPKETPPIKKGVNIVNGKIVIKS